MKNYVSEEQAKEKWCPFSGNRKKQVSEHAKFHGAEKGVDPMVFRDIARCLGSKCMMFCDVGSSATARYYCGLARGE